MHFQQELERIYKRDQVRYARLYVGQTSDPELVRAIEEDDARISKRNKRYVAAAASTPISVPLIMEAAKIVGRLF